MFGDGASVTADQRRRRGGLVAADSEWVCPEALAACCCRRAGGAAPAVTSSRASPRIRLQVARPVSDGPLVRPGTTEAPAVVDSRVTAAGAGVTVSRNPAHSAV